MTTRVYLWCLFGSNPLADALVKGASRDLAQAMRAVEPELKSGRAFIGIIEEAQLRINVSGLEETYSPTGRRWSGRRDRGDGVHWDAKGGEPDPAAVYRVPDVAAPVPGADERMMSIQPPGAGDRSREQGGENLARR